MGLYGRSIAFGQVFEVVTGRVIVHSSCVAISRSYATALTLISGANTVAVGADLRAL